MTTDTSGEADASMTAVFGRALGLFRRAWPQLVAADLATRVAATLLLAPAIAFVARWSLDRAAAGVVTDQDILWFVLTPVGIVTLLFVGAGILLAGLLGHAAIMTIAAGAAEDRAVSWQAGLRFAAGRMLGILRLALRGLVRLLADAAPWLAAGGGIYLLLLTEHDINYYLAEKPPRFWWAAALIGGALAGLLFFVGRRLLGWAIALPRLLFGGTSPGGALSASAEAVQGRRRRVLTLLLVWGACTVALAAVLTLVAGWLGSLFVPQGEVALPRLAAGLAIAAIFAAAGSLVASVVSTILLALTLYELDRAWASSWTVPASVGGEAEALGGRARIGVPAWAWLLLVIAVPLGVLLVGVRMLEGVSPRAAVEIVAHRGASGRAPENTMAAFRAAIEDGADTIELDVQETADGIVVVHHDADFMRVAGDARKIWETPWEDVSRIDNGSWYGPEFAGERIVRLKDVLALTGERIRVNIELKTYGHGQRLEERVVEIVERLGREDEVVLMSLDGEIVAKLKALRPDWTVGRLAAVSLGDPSKLEGDFLALNAGRTKAGLVKRVQRRGKRILVWTVNHPARMSSMVSLGVDGLITDEPARARAVLEERARMTPLERLLVSAGVELGLVEVKDEDAEGGDA